MVSFLVSMKSTGSKSVGSTSPISSALFAPLNWTPSLDPFRSFRGNNEPSSRGGPKPELPTPVTYFPRRYRDCDPFCRARETETVQLRRPSLHFRPSNAAGRPTASATRQSTLPQCTHSLSASILFGEAFFTWKGIIGARKAGLKSFRNGTGCIFS